MSGLVNLIPGVSQAKAIAGAIGLAALAVPIAGWAITAHTLHGVRQWQASIVATTSTAAHLVDKQGRPRLIDAKDTPAQIAALGQALDQVRAKTAQAQADDAAHAHTVEQAQDLTTKEHDDDLQGQLADARALVDDYARRLRATPPRSGPGAGGGGSASMPGIPDPSPITDGSGSEALVPVPQADLDTCAANTVRLANAVDWAATQKAIPR